MGSGIIGAAWIRGDLPGLSGVALADNLTTLDTKITIRQNNLEQKLLTVQKKEDKKIDAVTVLIIQANLHQVLKNRCVAISAHNQLALESANQSIEEYDDQFRNIKGYSFPEIVYPCSVLLIGPDGH
jgi:hypothetical protein